MLLPLQWEIIMLTSYKVFCLAQKAFMEKNACVGLCILSFKSKLFLGKKKNAIWISSL